MQLLKKIYIIIGKYISVVCPIQASERDYTDFFVAAQ